MNFNAYLPCPVFRELVTTNIRFDLQEGGAPLESSVDYFSLLRRVRDRQYKILLNDSRYTSYLSPILLRKLPFDAQVGILVHELGHTRYYNTLNLLEMGSWALKYGLKPGFRASHERSTDALVVYLGMGWQLLDYAEYVRYDASTQGLYQMGKYFMDTFYLHPSEVEKHMDESGLYQ